MKKIGLFILFLLCLSGPATHAQTGLRVDSLINFPLLPSDTAIANHVYDSIQIVIHNYSTSVFTGDISVYYSADSLQHIGALRSDTTTVCVIPPGGDTIIQADTGFVFDPVNFAAGDNIVVVWPSLRIPFPIDSLSFNIYFQLGTGLEDPEAGVDIRLWPVPARQILRFDCARIEKIEQVRIYDMAGRLVLDSRTLPPSVDVTSWQDGLYFVQITRKDGSHFVKKILKQ